MSAVKKNELQEQKARLPGAPQRLFQEPGRCAQLDSAGPPGLAAHHCGHRQYPKQIPFLLE